MLMRLEKITTKQQGKLDLSGNIDVIKPKPFDSYSLEERREFDRQITENGGKPPTPFLERYRNWRQERILLEHETEFDKSGYKH